MKKFKNNKGITLVALIITIIVLLILAIVAISAVNGDGIISKAKIARKNYQDAQDEESLALAGYLTDIKNANAEPKIEGKTLNPNTGDLITSDLLNYCGSEEYNSFYSKLIVYKNGSNTIEISIGSADTMNYMQSIIVAYKHDGIMEKYAFKNWKSNEYFDIDGNLINLVCANYDHIPSLKWACPGEGRCSCSACQECVMHGFTARVIWEEISELPVFEGKWELDVANSDSGLVEYLSNILIDIE